MLVKLFYRCRNKEILTLCNTLSLARTRAEQLYLSCINGGGYLIIDPGLQTNDAHNKPILTKNAGLPRTFYGNNR